MSSDERSNQPDTELARRAAAGDEAAFEELHRRYRRTVYALALRMTRDAADAEDLTQESFLNVLRSVGSFRGEAAFSSWLHRLAANVVKMHFRRRSARPEDLMSHGEMRERRRGGTGDTRARGGGGGFGERPADAGRPTRARP